MPGIAIGPSLARPVRRPAFNLDAWLVENGGSRWSFTPAAVADGRLMQEATGPTPVTAVGQPIGLALDSGLWGGKTLAQVVAGQPELVVNGDFSSASDWAFDGLNAAGISIAGGKLNFDGTSTNFGQQNAFQSIGGMAAGKIYKVQYTVNDYVTGAIRINAGKGGAALGTNRSANGTFIEYLFPSGTSPNVLNIQAGTGFIGSIDNVSVKLIPGYHATQSNVNLKPVYQTTGGKYDGLDDNLLTGYTAGPGENFIAALVTVPASIPSINVIAGTTDGIGGRFRIGIDTSGRFCAGVGSQLEGTIFAAGDLHSTKVVVGLSIDGSTVRLFSGATLAYAAAQAGVPPVTIPFRIGALNSNGTATNCFAGSIKRIIAAPASIDLPTWLNIARAMAA